MFDSESWRFEGYKSNTSWENLTPEYEGYRMVFASICEHASSVFIFASTSSSATDIVFKAIA